MNQNRSDELLIELLCVSFQQDHRVDGACLRLPHFAPPCQILYEIIEITGKGAHLRENPPAKSQTGGDPNRGNDNHRAQSPRNRHCASLAKLLAVRRITPDSVEFQRILLLGEQMLRPRNHKMTDSAHCVSPRSEIEPIIFNPCGQLQAASQTRPWHPSAVSRCSRSLCLATTIVFSRIIFRFVITTFN